VAVKEDPVSLRRAMQVRTTKLDEIVEHAVEAIGDIEKARSPWAEKLARLYRQRFGIRNEKIFPWPGAANLHFPLIDKTIRRLKAMFVRLVIGAYPIVTIAAQDQGLARKVEQFLEWLLRIKMAILRPLVILADAMLSFGKGFLKVTWNYETRSVTEKRSVADIFRGLDPTKLPTPVQAQMLATSFGLRLPDDLELLRKIHERLDAGDEDIAVVRDVVVHDEPLWTVIHPMDLYVEPGTGDIEQAEFIAHRIRMSSEVLRSRERAGFYKNTSDVIEFAEAARPTRFSESIIGDSEKREDVTRSSAVGEADIHECYLLHDINGDGVKERCVLTIHVPTKTALRFIEFPYWHGEWPITAFDFELTDGRWLSARGVSDLLEDIEKEIDIQHNAKIDSMSLTNAPIGFYARSSGLQPDDIQWIPGQFVPLANPQTDVVFPVLPSHEISYEREESILRAWAEDLAGTLDVALTRQDESRNPRTATEIEATQGEVSSIFGLDSALFQDSLRRVYGQTLALWKQFGPDDVEIAVVGEDLPIKVSRQELLRGMDMIPTGTPANVNASLRLGRAIQFLQVLSQSGPVENVSMAELIRYIAQLQDPLMARLIIHRGGMTGMDLEAERQLDEITRMMAIPGYRAPLRPSDNDEAHAKIVESVIQSAGESLARTDAGTRIMEHGMAHQARLTKRQQGGGLKVPKLDEFGRPAAPGPDAGALMGAMMAAAGGRG